MKWYGWTTQSVAPASEPLTTAETKTFLRIDHDDEDTLIGGLITAAREQCEAITKRQLITATYTLKLNNWPASYARIHLQRSPLQSIGSITYYDMAGSSQTLSSSLYQVNTSGLFGSVIPAYGETWPDTETGKENAITITYDAGYGDDATDVPESLRTGMLMLVSHFYENRESTIAEIPTAVKNLFAAHSVKEAW